MTKAIEDREPFRFGLLLQQIHSIEKKLTDDPLYMDIIEAGEKDLTQTQNTDFTEMLPYEESKSLNPIDDEHKQHL